MLPRGAGSSQCGQTVGDALVIDHSRSLDNILVFDRDAMTVSVEPGIVLDRLNACLQPHGLWFPVDVSTSAQATIGGMAGNNSCGARSIAYGNMVHNVLGIDAVLADGSEIAFGPVKSMARNGRAGEARSRALPRSAARERDEIARMFPHVLRRVGGYNLDVFHPQSVLPYTSDGSVNLAQLLVGSEGTLAWFSRLTLKLAPLPASKVLGVVNFPSVLSRDGSGAAHRRARADRSRAGRPHDDRSRARNPVFRADHRARADRRSRRRSCWWSSPATASRHEARRSSTS